MTLRTASNLVFFDLHENLRQQGELSPSELNVLLIVALQREVEFRTLIRFAALKKATASALVDALVKRGHLSRRASPEDRRVLLLSLTDAGVEVFQRAFASHNDREQAWSALLSDEERSTLVQLLTRMISRGFNSESVLQG